MEWILFTGHFQDYEPSVDHLDFMRTAIHDMLITNNFNDNTIYIITNMEL